MHFGALRRVVWISDFWGRGRGAQQYWSNNEKHFTLFDLKCFYFLLHTKKNFATIPLLTTARIYYTVVLN
jgi:hypothetical protein